MLLEQQGMVASDNNKDERQPNFFLTRLENGSVENQPKTRRMCNTYCVCSVV